MSSSRWILPPRRIRVVLYVLIVALLFLFRGPRSWEGLRDVLMPPEEGGRLHVAGRELAPELLDTLLSAYQRDYPAARIETSAGAGAYALEALIDGHADVALLARALHSEETTTFEALEDGLPVAEPIAVGALALYGAEDAPEDSISWESLRTLLAGGMVDGRQRLYVVDPNRGSWDALVAALGVEPARVEPSASVVFLADGAAVEQAVRQDPRALGLRAVFHFPIEVPAGLALLALSGPGEEPAVRPTYDHVGYGRYPLTTRLHVVCRASARGEAPKLVTFASGARGQRRLERAGFLPARRFLREILLDRAPVGAR